MVRMLKSLWSIMASLKIVYDSTDRWNVLMEKKSVFLVCVGKNSVFPYYVPLSYCVLLSLVSPLLTLDHHTHKTAHCWHFWLSNVWVFLPLSNSLGHQPGVRELTALLTLWPRSWHQIPQVKGSASQTALSTYSTDASRICGWQYCSKLLGTYFLSACSSYYRGDGGWEPLKWSA